MCCSRDWFGDAAGEAYEGGGGVHLDFTGPIEGKMVKRASVDGVSGREKWSMRLFVDEHTL